SSTKSVVTSQTDAYGNKTTFDYAQDSGSFDPLAIATETRPDGTAVKYRHTAEYRPPTSITDASGKTVNFKISSFNNSISSVTDRLGGVTSFTYNTTGYRKLLSITNAAGNKMSFTYTAQDTVFTNPANKETVTFTFRNLSKVAYPDNTVEEIAYDDKGNVSVYTDRAGKKWQYEYNGRGQAVKITNPSGGVITYDYNADGTLKSSKDSDTDTTAYAYDSSRRAVKVTRPDGKTVQVEYDKNDRIISLTDEKGHKYIYAYDDNGNLTEIKDPAGSSLKYAYDLMDRVEKITDRLGNTRVLAYNNMGRLASVIDPTSVKTEFGYDPRGWVNEIKQAGKTWKIAHDDESVVSSVTTPAGNTTAYQTDALGHVTKVTDSSDAETNLVLDTMSRVTEISDALNRKTGYAYDPEGRLSGITLPAVGKAVYERNDLGIVRQITDLKGSPWKFDYSEAGRISSMSDPLGNQWNYTRDTRGRVSQIAYPDGVTQTINYDDTGNIAGQSYSKGPDMKFDYDALDRLLSADSISLVRDAEGNITDTRQGDIGFGAVYDAAGRLKTVTYNNGALTVEYVYNAENGLLTGVKDTLTQKEVTFAYDDDRQLVGITRSNGVNTTYDYDETGKLIRIRDGSIIDLKYSFDKAGQIIGADITVPLSPEALLVKQSSEFDYNEASQVSSDKYAYDKRGRLTASPDRQYSWDGASRLIKIGDVNLTYNGMDDVLTRNDGTSSIRYFYNYAVGLNPVMAEKNETGSFLRYYVWTPGGQLLYMIDAENGNKAYYYHFDHAGSTLALSDAAGTVTDKYAYLPYGELLKHEGSNPQPFTFIGKFGVRLESATLYQMRARYYDAKTGRFLSGDTLWPRIAAPMEINPYIYAAANPTGWIDPTGLSGYKLGGGFWDPDFMGNRETKPNEKDWNEVLGIKEGDWNLGSEDDGGSTPTKKKKEKKRSSTSDTIRGGIEIVNTVVGVVDKVTNFVPVLAQYNPYTSAVSSTVGIGLSIERATTLSDPVENAKRVGEDSERIWISPGRWGNEIGVILSDWWYKDQDEYLKMTPAERDEFTKKKEKEAEMARGVQVGQMLKDRKYCGKY
ncbi:MAG: hypothetical protein BWK80_43695, partial [Desulfobacteraceae bacterium IS3]